MENIVIVGCGDIGCRTAARCVADECTVYGVVRSTPSAERARVAGATPLQLDLDRDADVAAMPDTAGALVFYFAPPPRTGIDDPRLARFLNTCGKRGQPRRIVYISTSGVYGDCGGDWVDETRPLAPRTERAHRRVAAEARLHDWSERSGAEAVILRVPGIYGPGRLPIERLRRRLPVIRPEDSGYSNRIHADDLADAAVAAAQRGAPGRAYNIADGHPSTMSDYFNRVADLMGLPRPPQVTLAEARTRMSAAMLSFVEESRRLVVLRMREELKVEPKYPDLASGLAGCLPAR